LGDARSEAMQSHMNLKIKFREGFRPFAPMVLADEAANYFDVRQESPYMLLVYPVSKAHRREIEAAGKTGIDLLKVTRSDIPAVTHVDYSARVQTVDSVRNPFVHDVMRRFRERTRCGVIVNTSFNVRGEPIVATPEDAFRCFMGTEIDVLAVGNCLLIKDSQSVRADVDYRHRFETD
jgi:carbamoyltransferase